MKRVLCLTLLLFWSTVLLAGGRSRTIVVIDGAKYYIHTVDSGETLYGLARSYGVGEQVIVGLNPTAAEGLRAGDRLKIPCTAAVSVPPTERKLRRTFDLHTVAEGETLYAISRRYALSLGTVIEDNPEVDPIRLHPGERILIRRKERGTTAPDAVQAQWERYRDDLNSVMTDGTSYHLVQRGETLYGLARRYGTTVERISALNAGLTPESLKAGAIIRIPSSGAASVPVDVPVDIPRAEESRTSSEKPLFAELPRTESEESARYGQPADTSARRVMRSLQTFDPSHELRVALLLPLSAGGRSNPNYLEFYQGFLLGLDSVKRAGYSVHVDLFNTERSAETTRRIVEEDPAFRAADLIVGPVYEEPMWQVLRHAETRGVPVVSPLADIAHLSSDVLFQMAPPADRKYDKARALVDSCERITFIYSEEGTDAEFEREMRALAAGRSCRTHRYRYEHASEIEARGDRSVSPSDLTPLLHNRDRNLFVILSDNELEVDRILAALASAHTSIVSRGYTPPRFVVLGNARWNRYNNISREIFFKDHVVFFSTYHAKRDSERICRFDSDYVRAFGALPTLYSYRGYDAALIFAPAMFGAIADRLEGQSYTPLQTTYRFGRAAVGSTTVNGNWTRVNYNDDFSITVE